MKLDGGPDHVDNCTPSKSPTKVRLRKQIAMHRRREARLRNKLKHANMLTAHLRKGLICKLPKMSYRHICQVLRMSW